VSDVPVLASASGGAGGVGALTLAVIAARLGVTDTDGVGVGVGVGVGAGVLGGGVGETGMPPESVDPPQPHVPRLNATITLAAKTRIQISLLPLWFSLISTIHITRCSTNSPGRSR
jgi:hypothetical protein